MIHYMPIRVVEIKMKKKKPHLTVSNVGKDMKHEDAHALLMELYSGAAALENSLV